MKKIKIMVASSIHGFEDQLTTICAQLGTYKEYSVLNSHIHTIPVNSSLSNKDNCLKAVEECDAFFGIIRPYYGSGIVEDEESITHLEMRKAIELDKPRWFVAHRDVVFAKQMMKNVYFVDDQNKEHKNIKLKRSATMNSKSIDLYNEVIQDHLPVEQRIGHWVQEFYHFPEILTYIQSQFQDTKRIVDMVKAKK